MRAPTRRSFLASAAGLAGAVMAQRAGAVESQTPDQMLDELIRENQENGLGSGFDNASRNVRLPKKEPVRRGFSLRLVGLHARTERARARVLDFGGDAGLVEDRDRRGDQIRRAQGRQGSKAAAALLGLSHGLGDARWRRAIPRRHLQSRRGELGRRGSLCRGHFVVWLFANASRLSQAMTAAFALHLTAFADHD